MPRKHINYSEGQWFSIPLREGDYALGIIVRGNYHTKGGLGYFFGSRYHSVPAEDETYKKTKENAIFIGFFGDLGIITGKWPIILSKRAFSRQEWPVPVFFRELPLHKGKAVLVKYDQNYSGNEPPINEKVVNSTDEILKLPIDGLWGCGAVEGKLSNLLK